jgi:hypothetical protein
MDRAQIRSEAFGTRFFNCEMNEIASISSQVSTHRPVLLAIAPPLRFDGFSDLAKNGDT